MNNRVKIALAVLAAWLIAVVALFAAGQILIGALVVGVTFGILRVIGQNANRISAVGVKGVSGLACPHCGGTQFKAKRSAGGKLALGLLAPKTRVRCVTCGRQYTRG